MGIVATAEQAKGIAFGIKYWFYAIFILLLLIDAVFTAVQAKSPEPFFTEVGKNVFEPVMQLQSISQEIIDNQGIADFSQGFFNGFGKVIWTIFKFYLIVFTVYMWISIFLKIADALAGNSVSSVYSFFIAMIIFYGIQEGYLFYLYSKEKDFFEIIAIPWNAVWTFIKCVPYLVHPALQKIEDIKNSSNLSKF